MKLVSLQLTGVGATAWSSRKLVFGDRTTQLYGPNGSGKTPVVQSILFALGYKIEFRDDIVERCDHVTLNVRVGEREFVIVRSLKSGFHVTVEEPGSAPLELINEREYSRFLLSLWGFEDRVLTAVDNKPTHIYSGQILPLFYLDQDHGYAEEYYCSQRWIKGQYAEAMRLVFGLVPKHPHDKRRLKNELKEKLEYLDRAVIRCENIIRELTADLGGPRRPVREIERELHESVTSLDALRESGGATEQVDLELDTRISQLQQQERTLARERSGLDVRVRGFAQIKQEIEVEANTVSLNEEARRAFASFGDICANEDCGLFARSSVSYGKSLLYLKDQIKDLERTNSAHQRRIDQIDAEVNLLGQQISSARAQRAELTSQSPVSTLVEVVSQLTESVIRLRRSRHIEQELTEVEDEYVAKLSERARVQALMADLDGAGGGADLDLLRVRNALCERITHWLSVLRTPNVPPEVEMDREFNVTFGGQKVSKFKGSTRTRIVLAIRTAVFDLVSSSVSRAPRFFVLDTPRQQDISRDDLAAYIAALQQLATERSVQIVYSTTNHRYELGDGDLEWTPDFPGVDHLMFLGTIVAAATDTKLVS